MSDGRPSDAPETLPAAADRGPHAVGVASLAVAGPEGRSLALDVWYPADPTDAAGREPAPHTLGQPHDAVLGAAARPGPHPLLLFSHGNSGLRQQSTFLTTHLASWGFVVAAPDHAGNTFVEMLGLESEQQRIDVHKRARRTRPGDLLAALDAVAAGGPWGALGHSFGGWTALKMPRADARVRAVCGLAPASEPFVGRRAFEPGELPLERDVPALLVAGLDDVLVEWDGSVLPLFERLAAPRGLVGIERTDHFHFCDGVEPLHGMHERTVRPRQTRPTRPYAELLAQTEIHRVLRSVVTCFAWHALAPGGGPAALDEALSAAALAGLDPHCRRYPEAFSAGTAPGPAARPPRPEGRPPLEEPA